MKTKPAVNFSPQMIKRSLLLLFSVFFVNFKINIFTTKFIVKSTNKRQPRRRQQTIKSLKSDKKTKQ